VAQWIHTHGGNNIRTYNNFAFRVSCEEGHLNVAQWLTSICDDYKIINVNYGVIQYKIDNHMWFNNNKTLLFIF